MFRAVVLALLLLSAGGCEGSPSPSVDLFQLPIVHINDFHARFEPTNWKSGACPPGHEDECVGGFARLYTAVMEEMRAPNALLLNAGDNYQGTLWYTFYKWRVVVEFMNKLPFDAMVLGNHEFDDKIAGVLPFLENINCTILVANIDDSQEPTFQNRVKPYEVFERDGRKIGVIGYMLSTTNELSNTEKLNFTDEVEAVNKYAKQLKEEGVDIIIGLSHSGIDVDEKVAERVEDIDVIVGGHTHTLLYTGDPPGNDSAFAEYPLVVTQPSGRRVPVVQAAAYSKYLGKLVLNIDDKGEVVSWSGNAILMDKSIPEDPQILEDLEPWAKNVSALGKREIGTTNVFLDSSGCKMRECNMGNLLTDAMVYEYVNQSTNGSWTYASIAVTNTGGIRTSIDEQQRDGVITYNDLALVQPFGNTIDVVELQGKFILEALELQVSKSRHRTRRDTAFSPYNLLQWSGLRVVFDLSKPADSRIVGEVMVLCRQCRVPEYEPLDPDKVYRIVMNAFLIGGGDGFNVIRDNILSRVGGRKDMEVMIDYIQKMSPLIQGLDGRIQFQSSDRASSVTLPS